MVNARADLTEGRTQNKAHNGSNGAVIFRYRLHSYREDGEKDRKSETKKERSKGKQGYSKG